MLHRRLTDFTISSNRHEIEFELVLLTTDLDHLIHVFTKEMKLSNIASIIGRVSAKLNMSFEIRHLKFYTDRFFLLNQKLI